MGRSAADALSSYLPPLIVRQLADRAEPIVASERRFHGAVVFADLSGFTTLTERLMARGPAGAEQLAELLNGCFGELIDSIAAHGGDVHDFAGDAILALWPVSADRDLAACALAATGCALALQRILAARAPVDDVQLTARAAVTAGPLWLATLGGVDERWEYLVAGDAIDSLGATLDATPRGGVALAPDAWALVSPLCGGTPIADGIVHVTDAPDTSATERDEIALDDGDARVRSFVAREALAHADAGGSEWLAEFRRVSILFIGIGGLDFGASDVLARAHDVVRVVQDVVLQFDGSINQLLADDKGTTLIAAWGLPATTHELDAARAIMAALEIRRRLGALGVPVSIGATTATVFCGDRGNARRRQYAMLGDAMNVAARLMRLAGDDIICDDATATVARTRVSLEPLPPVALKGKRAPVAVHRAQARIESAGRTERPTGTLVGRVQERRIIDRRLSDVLDGRGGILFIEGEPGIGKSQLAGYATAHAADSAMRVLAGAADAVESSTPYFAWRTILARLFSDEPDRAASVAARRGVIERVFADAPVLAARASLLSDVLPVDIPESASVALLDPLARAEALRDLVAHALAGAAAERPLLLLLEDAHWFDSASWAMLLAVARRVPRMLIVVATRPLSAAPPAAYETLIALDGAERIALAPFGSDDAIELVCRRLGVRAIPPEIARLVQQRAEGNPFFSEQLALALRDAGHLIVSDGVARLSASATDVSALDMPTTVQAVISARIDRLSVREQLTLKVSSVIGRLFRIRTLRDVHPSSAERAELEPQLATFEREELAVPSEPEPDLAYLFRHVITQEVAYGLLAFAQRRRLHRSVAEWYEQTYDDDDRAAIVPLLAHHWRSAEVADKAVDYLERGAAQALATHANAEALRFVIDADAVAVQYGLAITDARRARWEWMRADALLKLMRYAESEKHYLEALRLMGQPVPSSTTGVALGSLRRLAQHVAHRWMPSRVVESDAAARQAILDASSIHERLNEVSFWGHDMGKYAYHTLTTLTLAERAGPSKELQQAYHMFGFLIASAGLRGLYAPYRARAIELGRRVRNAETDGFSLLIHAIYGNFAARWDEVHAAAAEGAAIFEALGDRFRYQQCIVNRAWASLHQARLADARAFFEQVRDSAGPDGAVQAKVWSAGGLLAIDLLAREVPNESAVELVDSLLARGVDHSDRIMCHGLLAASNARRGADDRAAEHAMAATALIDRWPPAVFHTLHPSASVAALQLDLWMRAPSAIGRARAHHAIGGLRAFAKQHAIGKPFAWLMRGREAALDGRAARAGAAWEHAARIGDELGMPYEAALARLALARTERTSDSDRAERRAEVARLGAIVPAWLRD